MPLDRTARGHHFDFHSRACVRCGMTGLHGPAAREIRAINRAGESLRIAANIAKLPELLREP